MTLDEEYLEGEREGDETEYHKRQEEYYRAQCEFYDHPLTDGTDGCYCGERRRRQNGLERAIEKATR